MLKSIKKFFGFGDYVAPEVNPSAPYKVPEPAATTPIPLVVKEVVPVSDATSVITTPKATPAPAKTKAPAKVKAPAKPKAEKKPAVKRTPRAPKAPSA